MGLNNNQDTGLSILKKKSRNVAKIKAAELAISDTTSINMIKSAMSTNAQKHENDEDCNKKKKNVIMKKN